MSVLIVGMSHRSAPVTVLEKTTMDVSRRAEACRMLVGKASVDEAMVVSTCNRVEVYAVTSSFHTGVTDIVEVLVSLSGVDATTLRSHLYVRYADAAAEHLFAVAAGMDSMVVGEQQIIGQVRAAYQQAHELGTAGKSLHLLAQCALHTGKRVHSETAIDDEGASMVSFAFDQACRVTGWSGHNPLEGKTAVVLGAGAMASLAATHLGRLGVGSLVLANRTRARADTLAEHSRQAGVPATVVDWGSRAAAFRDADLIVSACGAGMFTVAAADVPLRRGADKPLVCIDLSMPRDIDDSVAARPGIEVVNIEYLHATRTDPTADSQKKALAILAEELGAYSSAQRVRDVVPAVSALRRHAAELVDSELARLDKKTPSLTPAERAEVERTVNRIVDKLLHQPTVRVKELAAHSGSVSYKSALQELFGLAERRAHNSDNLIHIDPASLLHSGGGRAGRSVSLTGAVAQAEAHELADMANRGRTVNQQHRHTVTAHRINPRAAGQGR
ncbi:glutamyl-tRNA reductase [Corynebacterium mendelii]|uniref:Glutamyl-tRNA reductase n=1 Tax=Corynebacterium mendelii TaxID=2765362 RepID=A0A939ITI1_9CORY|nr:glutamyl-tRNA reductase [Corynebacterium mendelii]MBN9643879.1 glutamyl-tRNA reductase [Corynebacterium mendelii]